MKALPRIDLALSPTPLQRLERLSRHTGVEFWMKRDDLTGDLGLGGNKVRKLEYLLGEAVSQRATHVLTTGGPQSNHARATAAAAARLGLQSVLLLGGRDPGRRDGNLLLDRLFGADIRFPGLVTPEDQAQALAEAAAELTARGDRPYVIPVGGSSPLGALGSLHCYRELAEQLPGEAWIACATGSGGTHAGLLLGARLLGKAVRVQGFSVWLPADQAAARTAAILSGACRLAGVAPDESEIPVDGGYLGERYGAATPACLAAIDLLAGLEGILLDHVYTGKAMAGLLDYIDRGLIRAGERVVFVHTGGAPALFAGA